MSATTSNSSINAPSGKGRRNLHKGQHTRAVLLDAGLGLASRFGLEGITIGALADIVSMSKSGVFAHFGSREDLQIAIIDEYYQRFEKEVFHPALQQPRGLPRLRAMFENWIRRVTEEEVHSGCIFISGAVEYDDREGPVSDALRKAIQTWMAALGRAVEQARTEGHLASGTDAHQMIFEIHGLILSVHYEARFLQNPAAIDRIHRGFERIVAYYASPAAATGGGT